MAILPTARALLKMVTTLSPLILTILILLLGFLEGNLNGIVYLTGLILAQTIGYLSRPLFGAKGVRPDIKLLQSGQFVIDRDRACNIIEDPWFSKYSCPSFHSLFYVFTITYLFSSSWEKGWAENDWVKFGIFICLFGLDAQFRYSAGCVPPGHYFWGITFGVILGTLWFWIIKQIDSTMILNMKSEKNKCDIIQGDMTCHIQKMKCDDVSCEEEGSRMEFKDAMKDIETMKDL